jgi:hypothetical protein
MKLVRKLPKYSLSFRFNQVPWNFSKMLRLRRRKWSRTKIAKRSFLARFRKPQRIKHLRTYRTKTKKIFRRFFAPKLTDRQLKKLFRSNSRYKTTFKRVLKTEHRFDILVTRFFMLVDIEMARNLIKQNYFLLNGKQCHSPRVVLQIGDLVSPSNIFTWTFLYKNLLNVTSSLKKYLNRLFLKFSYPFVIKQKKRVFREFGKYRRKNLRRIVRKIRDRIATRSPLKSYPIFEFEDTRAASNVRPFPEKPFVDEPRDFEKRNIQYYIKSKLQLHDYGTALKKVRTHVKGHYFRGNKFKFIHKIQKALTKLHYLYGKKFQYPTIEKRVKAKFRRLLRSTRKALKKKRHFRKIRPIRNRAYQSMQRHMSFFNRLQFRQYKKEEKYFNKTALLTNALNVKRLTRIRKFIAQKKAVAYGAVRKEYFFPKFKYKSKKKRQKQKYKLKKTKPILGKAKKHSSVIKHKRIRLYEAPLRINKGFFNQISFPKALKLRRLVFPKKSRIFPGIVHPQSQLKRRKSNRFFMKHRRKFIRKFEKVYRNKTRYSLVPVRRYPKIKKEDRVEVKVKKKPINPSLVFTKKRAFFLANKAKASIYKKRYIHKTIEITNPKLSFYSIFSRHHNRLKVVLNAKNPRNLFKRGKTPIVPSLPNLIWKKNKRPVLFGWRKFKLIQPRNIWQMKRLSKKSTAVFYIKKKFNNQYLQFRNFKESKLVSWHKYNASMYTKSSYLYIKKTKRLKTQGARGVLFLKQKVKSSKIHSVFPFSKLKLRTSPKKQILRVKRKYLRIKGFYKRYLKYKVECLFSLSETPFDKIQIKYKKINLLYKHRPIPYYFAEMNYKTLEFTLVSDVDFLFFPYRTFLDYKTFASIYPNS